MISRTRYANATKPIPKTKNVDIGAGVASCSSCIPNKMAANVKGMKKMAGSVKFATA